ncbi:glycine betaine ABC transporter substrate-binding protein [Pigmentiphaga soli]|uniref:Glycine betaine ABC transporter substrate-binding protein n=2 Tax=Pigmentiphaga soli TaxID=1007095 RepID=A0ABP8GK24_9BURK
MRNRGPRASRGAGRRAAFVRSCAGTGFAAALAAWLLAAAWGGAAWAGAESANGEGVQAAGAAASARTLTIGSKRFTESYILAQVFAQAAAPALRGPPAVKAGLGNTAVVYQALQAGAIDLYPEYAGTIAREILKTEDTDPDALRAGLAPLGLGAAIPLGFSNGYALAMRDADARRAGIATLSDLAAHRELRFGLSNEFIGRADGWPGLARRYRLPQTPAGLDHGLAYQALAQGRVDVIDIYSTDPKIRELGLRVLRDDQGYFPRYDALVLYRLDVPRRFPAAWQALSRLQGRIDEQAMIAMNTRAELDGVGFERIARDFLAAGETAARAPARQRTGVWDKLWGDDLARLAAQHVLLVAAAVALAAAVAVPLGVLAPPRAPARLLAAAGLLQTVPSLALLAVLIWLLGRIGTLPALAALTLYALLPIMRNTCVGMAGIAAGQRQAAMALGLRPMQRIGLVELPQALPSIVAGLRTATSISIGTATIAAFIGAGGFGERIVTGLALNDAGLLLAGALPAAALALLCELLFELAERRLRR